MSHLSDDDDAVLVESHDAKDENSSSSMQRSSLQEESSSTSDAAESSTAPSASSRAEAIRAMAREVDKREAATDEPSAPVDAAVREETAAGLAALPSPFDAQFQQAREADKWKSITQDGRCVMMQLQPGDGGPNVPVLNRVYGQTTATGSALLCAE